MEKGRLLLPGEPQRHREEETEMKWTNGNMRLGEREMCRKKETEARKRKMREKRNGESPQKTCTGLFHAEFIIINSQSGSNPHIRRQMNEYKNAVHPGKGKALFPTVWMSLETRCSAREARHRRPHMNESFR